MSKYGALLLASGIVLFVCGACLGKPPGRGPFVRTPIPGVTPLPNEGRMVGDCPVPPPSFPDAGFVGRWGATGGVYDFILILKEDFTYQQRYDNNVTGEHFESPWLPWWIERRPTGMLNLHMQGMKLCPKCDENVPLSLWDICEKRRIYMVGEVVLVVVDASRWLSGGVRGGIELFVPKILVSDVGSTVFRQEK